MSKNPNPVNLKWDELFKPASGFKADHRNHMIVEREVIPVIFLPGIMGSRLKDAEGSKVWDPDSAFFMLRKYGMFYVSAEERKEFLIGESFDPARLEVFNDDEKHNRKKFKRYKNADKRRWGGIAWSSYGKFLKKLDKHTFTDPIEQCFEFPLHACGYNWTGSNYDSGKAVKEYIDKVIQEYTNKGRKCEKVILVTHSMGGLVARSACCVHGAEGKVLGVLHGVQPATGSPAAYWRMKAGWERPSAKGPNRSFWDWLKSPLKMTKSYLGGYAAAWVLGTDGEEVTALLSNMPGGLELLPTADYVDNEGNKEWLRYKDQNGEEHKLPKSDPYSEIYLKKSVFYRLVNPEWLGEASDDSEDDGYSSYDPWSKYEANLEIAKEFHQDNLKMQVHSQTFQFFSSGLDTADHIEFDCALYSWGTKAKRMFKLLKESAPTTLGGGAVKAAFGLPAFTPSGLAVSGAILIYKDTDFNANRGGARIYANDSGLVVKKTPLTQDDWDELDTDDFDDPVDTDPESETTWIYTLKNPEGSGDGTVPVSSAKALKVKVEGWDEESSTEEIGKEDESGFARGHEPIYKTETGQHIAFAAIENFALLKIKEVAG